MQVAVIGAGFSGLAVAWHLLTHPSFSIQSLVLFDQKGIGGGASGIAAGLLHPFAGAHAKLNRFGREGMQATKELIQVAEKALKQPVAFEQGLLRPALNEEQCHDFKYCSQKYPDDAKWLESDACLALYPYLTQAPGVWFKDGITLHSMLYLQGLWQACSQLGAHLEIKKITSLDDLKEFDLKIFTLGAASGQFTTHPLSLVKGQVLELAWPAELPVLPFPLNSQAYLLMEPNQKICLAGATFERGFNSEYPDQEKACLEILPKVEAVLPALKQCTVVNCYAGLRAVTPTHLPVIEQIGKQEWLLTGMGSKGLLYHALMAKQLVKQILSSNISLRKF